MKSFQCVFISLHIIYSQWFQKSNLRSKVIFVKWYAHRYLQGPGNQRGSEQSKRKDFQFTHSFNWQFPVPGTRRFQYWFPYTIQWNNFSGWLEGQLWMSATPHVQVEETGSRLQILLLPLWGQRPFPTFFVLVGWLLRWVKPVKTRKLKTVPITVCTTSLPSCVKPPVVRTSTNSLGAGGVCLTHSVTEKNYM